MENFTATIQRAIHGLTDEESQALAFYVLCDIASKGSQTDSNLQFLKLQNSMQNENRQFTIVSNIMKTKHDTVKNTISNIH